MKTAKANSMRLKKNINKENFKEIIFYIFQFPKFSIN